MCVSEYMFLGADEFIDGVTATHVLIKLYSFATNNWIPSPHPLYGSANGIEKIHRPK